MEHVTRLDVPVTHNFRPVAGAAAGALYRSDALARLDRVGRARLRELGVARVVDLRSALDRRLGGRDRLRGVGADLVRVPMLAGARRSELPGLTLERLYRRLLDRDGAAIGIAVRAVADAPTGAVVVHCTAGKDRSGVVAALLQLAIGVETETVVDDYAMTEANLDGDWAARMRRTVRRLGVDLTPQLDRVLVASPAEAMAATIEHLDAEHDGVEAYLASWGVTDAHLERLEARLAA